MEIKDVTVIGGGLIGAAAARHLAEKGLSVTLLRAVHGNTEGIHASHYDEARITRFIGPDVIWADLAAEAIARYPDIETRSGIRFHTPCGHLRCDLPEGHLDSVMPAVTAVAAHQKNKVDVISMLDVQQRFPYLSFQENAVFHLDAAPAGIINPLKLIEAQTILAKNSGATVIDKVCARIERAAGGFNVFDVVGNRYRSAKVLVSAGAYTGRMHLSPVALNLEVRPETVVLMEVEEQHQPALAGMPGLIWNFDHFESVNSVYVLPPVRYPDGRMYVKIGADFDKEVRIPSVQAMHAYMTSEGSSRTRELLVPVLTDLIPILAGARIKTRPCMLTYTPSGYPIIDEVEKDWFVAAGGCGKSAKSSDQIGKLAADLVAGVPWDGFQRDVFATS